MKLIAFFLSLATLASAQSNGDLILQYKGSSGASLQYVTPSTGTGIPAFNGASPNRIELLPRSTFATPADVAAYAQPLDSDLTTLAGVTSTATGRNLLSSSSATAAKTVLGIGPTGGLTCFALQVIQTPTELVPGYFAFIDSTQTHVVKVGANAAPTSSFTIDLPTAAGEWLTSGSSLNASNIISGSLALARIAQGGATVGQALAWNGTEYAPTTFTNAVTSVAGRTGAITLSTSDISGLGTIATQATSAVAITGGSITGITAFESSDADFAVDTNGNLTAKYFKLTNSGSNQTSLFLSVVTGAVPSTPGAFSEILRLSGGVLSISPAGTGTVIGGTLYLREVPALIYGDSNTLNLGLNAAAVRQLGDERLWVVGGLGFAPINSAPNANDTFLMRRALGSLGLGIASATPVAQYLGGQDATGTNITGGDFGVRGGNGTGTGGSGKILFQTAAAGSSGTTANTLITRMEITKDGYIVPTLPTSSAGLPSGALWNDAGTVKVAP